MATEKQIAANRENAKKGGRPKGYAALEAEKAREILVERLGKRWIPIVDKAIDQAEKGDGSAREWLTTRGYGKIKDELELTTTIKSIVIKRPDAKRKS